MLYTNFSCQFMYFCDIYLLHYENILKFVFFYFYLFTRCLQDIIMKNFIFFLVSNQ